MSKGSYTYEVVKDNQRLHIDRVEDGIRVYTPPDFVRLPNREHLKALARVFTEKQTRCIEAITEFEVRYNPASFKGK